MSPDEGPDREALARAIRTLLPILRATSWRDRWSSGSPAVQAVSILAQHVGESTADALLPSPPSPCGECPTCGGVHRHGGDCHGEGKPAPGGES